MAATTPALRHTDDSPAGVRTAGVVEHDRREAATAVGAEMTIETIARSAYPPLSLRPRQETLLRVVAGAVTLTAAGRITRLELGEEARIPAATPYRLISAGFGEARVLQQLRPVR